MARLGMVIDLQRCVGCGACAFACKAENNTRSRADGQSFNWADFVMKTEGTFPDTTHWVMPVLCNHCTDAPCVKACPVNPKAMFKTPEGITLTDNDWRFVSLGDYASDGYTALRIVGKCREAAKGILVDWLLPFPLDYGSPFYFHCTANSLQRVTSRWLDAQMQLTTGAWRSARRYVYGPGLLGVDSVRLLVAACDANGAIRRPSVSLAADYSPLYTHWIPKPEV